jgi:RNA polymerase sigma-70 factor (ECF subfamily)
MERTKAAENENIQILLEKAKEGDRLAFKTIITLYQQKVFLLAYSILRNREDAMDIVQETFMRLYQKLDAYEREKNFQAWLLQMTKNLCIDYYRKNYSKRRELESAKSIEELNLAAEDGPNNAASSDLRRIFSRCLEKLTDRQRMIFILKHYNGLQYQEIAQVLNISVGTVKSLHSKAVQNLKNLLSPHLGRES